MAVCVVNMYMELVIVTVNVGVLLLEVNFKENGVTVKVWVGCSVG